MKKNLLTLLLILQTIFSFAQEVEKQDCSIKFTPSDALLMIDGDMVESSNGIFYTTLTLGEHTYNVVANGYHQQKGSFFVKKDMPCRVVVELLPKAGTVVGTGAGSSNRSKEIQKKELKKTTSATLLKKEELSFDDLINNPMGFVVCNGDKWTMNDQMLHMALKLEKIKCEHAPSVPMGHSVRKMKLARRYNGLKMFGSLIADADACYEYSVGLSNNTKDEADQFISSIRNGFKANGIELEEATIEEMKSVIGITSYTLIKNMGIGAYLNFYHAEDNDNRYELYHGYVEGFGKRYQALLIVKKK